VRPKRRPYISQGMRQEVAERIGCADGKRIRTHCPYCDALIEIDRTNPKRVRLRTADGFYEPEFDHMESLHDGGSHTADNLVPACLRCNRSKGKRSLLSSLSKAEAKSEHCFGEAQATQNSESRENSNPPLIPLLPGGGQK
jgi:5-methylcytosine-specific restriction endonuclease McrA